MQFVQFELLQDGVLSNLQVIAIFGSGYDSHGSLFGSKSVLAALVLHSQLLGLALKLGPMLLSMLDRISLQSG